MMNALIVDDEEPARSELRFLLEETGRIDCIEEASNGGSRGPRPSQGEC